MYKCDIHMSDKLWNRLLSQSQLTFELHLQFYDSTSLFFWSYVIRTFIRFRYYCALIFESFEM